MMPSEIFTVGRSPENQLTIYGEEYPKKQILFSRKNDVSLLHIPPFANGEVRYKESTLVLRDLIQHRLMVSHNGAMMMPLFDGKEGYIIIAPDVRIEFAFSGVVERPKELKTFKGFNWWHVTIKDLTQDIYFKFIFLFLLMLNSIVLYAYKDIKFEKPKNVDISRVARYAKIILNTAKEPIDVDNPTMMNQQTDGTSDSDKPDKNKSAKKSTRGDRKKGKKGGNTTVSKGLLGLISGVGSSNQSSSVLDFLVDKGLTADLNNVLQGGSNLRKGKKPGADRGSELDQFIGTGDGIGGIDDLLEDFDEVEEVVQLKKKEQVIIQKVQSQSGSKEAMGYRDIESITSKMNSVYGRILYIYQKYLRRDVDFRGKVTVEFTIEADGRISQCRVRESTMNNPALKADFEREIVSAIRHLSFDKIPKGSVNYAYPLVFQRIE
ncbi:energy transducer TonB [candidate division KSB1 bacterium]|nr:energy transducer TonB [candidate division KSB1 bacterium]